MLKQKSLTEAGGWVFIAFVFKPWRWRKIGNYKSLWQTAFSEKKKKRTIVGFAMKNYYYHLHIKSIKDHGNNKSLYYHSQKSSEGDVVSSRPPLTPLLWTSEYLLVFFYPVRRSPGHQGALWWAAVLWRVTERHLRRRQTNASGLQDAIFQRLNSHWLIAVQQRDVLHTLTAAYLKAEVFPARENCGEEPGVNKQPYFMACLKKTNNPLPMRGLNRTH